MRTCKQISMSDINIVNISSVLQLIEEIRWSSLHNYFIASTESMLVETKSHRKPTQLYQLMRYMFKFSNPEDKSYTVVLYLLNSTKRVLIQAKSIHRGAVIELR